MSTPEEQLKNLVFVSLISADNYEYSEDIKQEMLYRYHVYRDSGSINWDYVLDPLGEGKKRYMKILGS